MFSIMNQLNYPVTSSSVDQFLYIVFVIFISVIEVSFCFLFLPVLRIRKQLRQSLCNPYCSPRSGDFPLLFAFTYLFYQPSYLTYTKEGQCYKLAHYFGKKYLLLSNQNRFFHKLFCIFSVTYLYLQQKWLDMELLQA